MAGSIHQVSFYSRHLNSDKKVCLYLPPSYHHRPDLYYSTVTYLPGLMDYEKTWVDKGRIHEAFETLLAHGHIGEMILVMPDKDPAALNPEDEYYFAHYLATDLRNWVEDHLRAIPLASHRGIEGLSLGASWALKLAVNLPGLYSSVGVLSTRFSGREYSAVKENLPLLRDTGTRFFLSAGTGEEDIIPSNQHFNQFLNHQGLESTFSVEEGPHDWPLWQRVIYQSLPFHYQTFNP